MITAMLSNLYKSNAAYDLEMVVKYVWMCVCVCVVGREKQGFAVSRQGKLSVKFCTLHHVNENCAVTMKWTRCVLKWFAPVTGAENGERITSLLLCIWLRNFDNRDFCLHEARKPALVYGQFDEILQYSVGSVSRISFFNFKICGWTFVKYGKGIPFVTSNSLLVFEVPPKFYFFCCSWQCYNWNCCGYLSNTTTTTFV